MVIVKKWEVFLETRTIRGKIILTFTIIMAFLMILLGGILIPERIIKEREIRVERITMLANLLGEDEGVKQAVESGTADEELIRRLDEFLETYSVDYIVLAQMDGRRVYHPEHERIGQKFIGGDEAGILEGEQSYLSIARGTANKQQRAFYRINRDGEPIGFVMVSISLDSIHSEQLRMVGQLVVVFLLAFLIGFLAFEYVANSMQQVLFGYEPEEFANIYRQGEQTMRASTHEFLNKMHVVSGLLQMGEYDEAVSYIGGVTSEIEENHGTIVKNIENPTISALLLGKMSSARELDIQFSLRKDSRLPRHSAFLSTNDLVTIVGNLIENAFDAVRYLDGMRAVEIFIGETEEGLSIIVDDTGVGMTEQQIASAGKKGYTTKGKGHGTGLRLIRSIVQKHEGYFEIESEPGVGSSFTISIDKIRRDVHD